MSSAPQLVHLVDGHELPCRSPQQCEHCDLGDMAMMLRRPGTPAGDNGLSPAGPSSLAKKPAAGPSSPAKKPAAGPAMLGITLRDMFAAHAISGILSGQNYETLSPKFDAELAYQYADALLLARQQLPTQEGGQSS